jgi:hypothetical protein
MSSSSRTFVELFVNSIEEIEEDRPSIIDFLYSCKLTQKRLKLLTVDILTQFLPTYYAAEDQPPEQREETKKTRKIISQFDILAVVKKANEVSNAGINIIK